MYVYKYWMCLVVFIRLPNIKKRPYEKHCLSLADDRALGLNACYALHLKSNTIYNTPLLCSPDFTIGSNESKISAIIIVLVPWFCGPEFWPSCHDVTCCETDVGPSCHDITCCGPDFLLSCHDITCCGPDFLPSCHDITCCGPDFLPSCHDTTCCETDFLYLGMIAELH